MLRWLALALVLAAAPASAVLLHGGGSTQNFTPAGCPTNTVCAQIHNAPGWEPSTAYTAGAAPATRVNAGPGWTASGGTSGTYNNGQLLRSYQLTSGSNCTSASSGQGPTGTGSTISDGTCTWKYVSAVDYVTLTGWTYDGPAWTSGTYTNGFIVTVGTPLRSYQQTALGGCTSSISPSGTGTVSPGDGCTWQYNADMTYTSQAAYIPAATFVGNPLSCETFNLTKDYEAQIWNDREYVGGVNGENHPIALAGLHNGTRNQDVAGCTGGVGGNDFCGGNACHYEILTAATGESFADNLPSTTALTGYDATKGVGIKGALGGVFGSQQGFVESELFVKINRLQFKGVDGGNNGGIAFQGDNSCFGLITDNIFDGGSVTGGGTFTWDCQLTAANNFFIVRGQNGAWTKYDATYLHNTVICVGSSSNSVGILGYWNSYGASGSTVASNAIFGCTHTTAHLTGAVCSLATSALVWLSDSLHNATDVASTDTGTTFTYNSCQYSSDNTIGGTYSLTEAGAFVNPGSDWRYKTGSTAAGLGANYGSFSWPVNCSGSSGCGNSMSVNYDTPDMIGTTRPGSTGVDPGSWQKP